MREIGENTGPKGWNDPNNKLPEETHENPLYKFAFVWMVLEYEVKSGISVAGNFYFNGKRVYPSLWMYYEECPGPRPQHPWLATGT